MFKILWLFSLQRMGLHTFEKDVNRAKTARLGKAIELYLCLGLNTFQIRYRTFPKLNDLYCNNILP